MAIRRNKVKFLKSKQSNKKSTVKTISRSQKLPPGHRFDVEIANACSNLLIKAQIRRIEQPTSVDNFLKLEIRKLVGQHTLSKISSMFFENILDVAREHPLTSVCQKLLEVTYEEYCIVSKHMKSFEELSMKMRVRSLLDDLIGLGWHVDINFETNGTFPDEPFCCLAIYAGWEMFFNEDGMLTESISIAVRTEDINYLTELAYRHGLLFYRQFKKYVYFNMKIHPDNNIPGIPMSPPSVRKQSGGQLPAPKGASL